MYIIILYIIYYWPFWAIIIEFTTQTFVLLQFIHIYNYLHNNTIYTIIFQCRDCLTCTAPRRQLMKKEENSSPSLETSHAMSLAVTAYMHELMTTIFLYIRHLCHVCPRDNFPGNNDPYTVPPSTHVTGTINDTRSCIYTGLHWVDNTCGKLKDT